MCNNNRNKNSSLLPIKPGVPEGSILEPILFILYINDINKHIVFKNIEYIDDTIILVSHGKLKSLNAIYRVIHPYPNMLLSI